MEPSFNIIEAIIIIGWTVITVVLAIRALRSLKSFSDN